MKSIKPNILFQIILLVFTLIVLFYWLGFEKKENTYKHEITPLTQSWEKAIPHQSIPKGLTSLTSASCGSCHQEIYKEWKLSTHSDAYVDPQFLSEWKKDGVYLCINCHAPLQNQQKYVVTGIIKGDYLKPIKHLNPDFDPELQKEGINCASCHVRNGSIIGTTDSDKTPHKTIQNKEFLSEKLCISCHNIVEELNPKIVCSFETGDEWKEGPARAEGKNCISCHMPSVEREVVTGFGKKEGHRHYFPGSGISKFANKKVIGLTGYEFTPGKVKDIYYIGDSTTFQLTIKNKYAGHKVPTGDPERFFLINFIVVDVNSSIIENKQFRIGEKWQWYPEAKKLSDNNLKPGEQITFEFPFKIPDEKGLSLKIKVTKHRMNAENANYDNIPKDYPTFITVFEKNYPLNISLL